MIYPADIRDNLSLTGLTTPTYNQVTSRILPFGLDTQTDIAPMIPAAPRLVSSPSVSNASMIASFVGCHPQAPPVADLSFGELASN